jgi:macrolide transport system ATP-binding/permease protein
MGRPVAAELGRDLVHAIRSIGRMPGLAAVVILSLGIGIGVNTAIFSWVQLLVLQPLPGVSNSSALLLIEPRAETGSYPGTSWLEYGDLRERLPSFADLMASRSTPLSVGESGNVERVYGLLVSGNYFSALGLRPALGRFLSDEEVSLGSSAPVAVISHAFWQTRFKGAQQVVGQTMRVNSSVLTVVGVAPPAFQGTVTGFNFDMWIPATLAPLLNSGSRELEDRRIRGYSLIGRLKPSVGRTQAQSEVDQVMRQLAHDFPDTNRTIRAEVMPFWQTPRGPRQFMLGALAVLQSVLLLVLLAVCGNTANLVLARASARQREIAVRLAMGAGRWRVMRLLLAENLVLGLLGAALGAAIAVWGTDALRAVPLPGGFPIRFQTQVDALGVGFAMLLGALSGIVFGMPAAVQLSRAGVQSSLRAGASTRTRSRLRDGLMAAQVALALVVLVIAALFFKSFRETRDIDPGFARDGVLLAAYDLAGRRVDGPAALDFSRRLLDQLRTLPAVETAAIASSVPLDIHGLPMWSFTIDGRARTDGARDEALVNTVTPGYFATMRIRMVTGTDFAPLDDRTTAPQVIVNEEFVRRFIGDREALGRGVASGEDRYVIAAVVSNSLYETFGEPPTPALYFSYRDRPTPRGEMHLRARAGSETSLASEIRRVMRDLDPSLPVYNVRTLSDHVETNLIFRRIPARMFAVLGPLLLLLAAIGVYAVVAYAVSQRTAEISLRLALGATGQRIITQIVGESLRVIGLGALVGVVVAGVIVIDLFEGSLGDVSILVGVPIVLLLVALSACWVPANRATRIDPMLVLKDN